MFKELIDMFFGKNHEELVIKKVHNPSFRVTHFRKEVDRKHTKPDGTVVIRKEVHPYATKVEVRYNELYMVGESKCSDSDVFNRSIGRQLAFIRAIENSGIDFSSPEYDELFQAWCKFSNLK